MSAEARVSVVIPAHDEEAVIARCLGALMAATTVPEAVDVIVVANGCSDRTVERARTYAESLPGLRVLDRPEPGKIGALNAGDEVARAFPRIYLDADIELGPGALDALVASLSTEQARVASPHVDFDLVGCSLWVRAFYRAFEELPYATQALIGLGVYGLSAGGRRRFAAFPDVIADDLFVDRLFGPSERLQSAGTYTVRAPRTLPALLSVRTRIAQGNAELARSSWPVAQRRPHGPELDAAPSTRSTVRALLALLARRPWRVVDVATYVLVTGVARTRARRTGGTWHRDDSTR